MEIWPIIPPAPLAVWLGNISEHKVSGLCLRSVVGAVLREVSVIRIQPKVSVCAQSSGIKVPV